MLLIGGGNTHITESLLKRRPLYNPITDLDPISNIALTPFAIVIHPSVAATSLKQLIDHVKANPGKFSYGSAGVGSLNHLTGELFISCINL